MSPALPGGFLTTRQPGKSNILIFEFHNLQRLVLQTIPRVRLDSGYRVSLGMNFLGTRFLTVAITEESVVNLERGGSWYTGSLTRRLPATPGRAQVQPGLDSDYRPNF